MLIAHAASTCDVCLDGYREDCSYHSIPCGHVFCLPCLVSTSPAKCPLCRHEFTPHGMRKVHLTLPSERDLAARRLELKLVQSSPDMTLAESLLLFQEVQEWLESEAHDEFLVLRAFAAVLCGFHETKDKLQQTEARAERNEAALLRSLDEARKALAADSVDYKAKYQTAKSELAALRAECADLRTKAEQAHKYNTDIQAYYAQAQPIVQSQPDSEPQPRRISNPLPAPPRPIEIPLLKTFETHPPFHSRTNKGKSNDIPTPHSSDADVDPMTSAFVPTLSASITSKSSSSNVDGRSEVTTLVFKPPKRMPVWDSPNTSYARIDAHGRMPPSAHSDSSSRPASYADSDDLVVYSRTNERPTADIQSKPSGLNSVLSENIHPANQESRPPLSRPTSYVEGSGKETRSAALLQEFNTVRGRYAYQHSRASSSENNDKHEYTTDAVTAANRPVSYTSSPRAASYAPWETPSTQYARPILPTSRSREHASTEAPGINLRRASSPVVMLSDTDTRPRLLSRRPERKQEGSHSGLHLPYQSGISDGETPVSTGRRHLRRRSPSPDDARELDIGARRPQVTVRRRVQNEDLTPREYGHVEFPPSPRPMDEEYPHHNARHVPHNLHATISHSQSRSLASNIHQEMARSPSPVPVRERAQSHSHAYPVASFSPNRRQADYVTPINRRLTLDLSIAGPGAAFHTMDTARPRAMPVAEV